MKKRFVVEQKTLLNLLASMQPICIKRTPVDATSFILFQVGHRELVLKATDLEVSLQASCSLQECSLIDTESFLVSGKRIFEVVKELEGLIICDFSHNQLSLQSDTVHLALNIKDTQEFPPFPERIENLMHLDTISFSNMLDHVAFLIPQNNANPALNGLLIEITSEEMTLTATDGHCLAQVKTPQYKLEKNASWLLPRRAVFEIKKLLETSEDKHIFLGICNNQLVFSGELFNFFTKLLAYPFPHYKTILDKSSFMPATIDRNRFIKTLRRSACLLSGQFLATKFGFASQVLRVSLHNKEVGKQDEELSLSGFNQEPLDIRFYAPYLLHGLQTLPDQEVTFYLQSTTKPIIFESQYNNLSLTYLVMPVSPAHTAS